MTTLRAGGSTDVGRVRSSNEDAYFIGDGLYAVADGVGGHQAGEVASATAIEALAQEFTTRTTDGLVQAFHAANEAVWTLAQESTERRGMGTTLTAVALVADDDGAEVLALANVGDSRGYLLQGGDLIQITEDHSLVGELVREGQITAAEARVHPRRSIITRAMGMAEQIEVDTWTVDPAVGDRILLCSDGLTNEVSDNRIAAALRRLRDPADCADELIRLARAGGGNDNITVVVVDVVDEDGTHSTAVHQTAGSTTSPSEDTGPVAASDILDGPAADPWSSSHAVEEPPRESSTPVPVTRRLTWRVVAFGAVVLAIVGLGVAALAWYARGSYFVGLEGDRVAIFQGRPGGLLWFQPTLERVSDLDAAEVAPARRAELVEGKARTSLEAAERFVDALADEAVRLGLTEPTTTTTTTTTTTSTTTTTIGTTATTGTGP